ncbi:hypothetical protein FDF86_01325 [Clostridium botulinum]|nr:hypothetical protein [Clostridium botulinum]
MSDEEILEGQISVFEVLNLEKIKLKNSLNIKRDTLDRNFNVNDKVKIEYDGRKVIGKIVRIYNKD